MPGASAPVLHRLTVSRIGPKCCGSHPLQQTGSYVRGAGGAVSLDKKTGQGTYVMSILKSASALMVGAVISLGAVATSASAADLAPLPVKAKPIVGASAPLDVHGWFDATFANNRVTGGGLVLYPSGAALAQINVGLSLDIYKDPAGFVNGVSVYGGVWNEWWLSPDTAIAAGARSWQEMDFYVGVAIAFAQYWKVSAEYVQFNFPSAIPTARNMVFTLSYSDAHWGLPVPFNPYVSVFYNIDGGSTVVFGKTSDTYRVTVGVVPTLEFFQKDILPLTLTFPTSVTFAPKEFYANGNVFRCGATNTVLCDTSSLGFYTTGVAAKWSLANFIPKRLGNWYVKAEGHYYHISNDALLAAQVVTGAATSFNNAKEDVFVGSGSFGFTF
jgi:hypothetical protein